MSIESPDPRKPGLPPPRLFSTDLDGTLLGNPEATDRFRRAWCEGPARRGLLFVPNSGRTCANMRELIEDKTLPPADFLISGVGTGIHDGRSGRRLDGFDEELRRDWDVALAIRVLAAFPAASPQPEEFQNHYKSSWFLPHATPAQLEDLRGQLAAAGLRAQIIYSGMRFLDVLPAAANKGGALRWLARHLGIPTEALLVAGDSGNDRDLFLLPGARGIVVGNADPDLLLAVVDRPVIHAEAVLADGVLEGLRELGLLHAAESPPCGHPGHASIMPPDLQALFDAGALATLSPSEAALIREGYDRAIDALALNITPLGYSACSLHDNDSVGTDENYRSVWARDGAITLIHSLAVDLPKPFRDAERATLETLLGNLSPAGQVPSNVRIDTGVPDYSGVGGIASIDSGLWVVIAVWNYVHKTRDTAFLDRHLDGLAKAMAWLGAHDSNNDHLLEIPEAGDWTDLFGRSYNVLYDEVLWYRANVCYARLLELKGECDAAARHFLESSHIREAILRNFWPSTRAEPGERSGFVFADQQFSLGDAQYLIAQVSPFGFNWRCDVFGNILAFLCNVLDVDRAKTAFRFLWGVGVNSPHPVANLYPPVQSGDPDWRSYYTVNLLNLPNHYHNGGIWPFIGGMWVRFLHRLGLEDVAARELVRLASLNQLGRESAWEFNEWAHGITGRPMGKRYQAWSAASYIRACAELGFGATDPETD